jgi:serine/threonine-protein kinase
MAPEPIAGPANVRDRTDVYAAALVVYHALTGRSPGRATTPSLQRAAHLTTAPEALTTLAPAVPAALAALIHRALSKPPEAGPDAAEFAAELHAVADALGAPPLATLVAAVDAAPSWSDATAEFTAS